MSAVLPEIVYHISWVKKDKFLLETDTYVTWVLFAVEQGKFEYQIGEDYGVAEFGDIVVCPPQVAFYRNVLEPLSFHSITFNLPGGDPQQLQALLADRKFQLPHIRRLAENYSCLRKADQDLSYNPENLRLRQHYLTDLWLMIIEQALESPVVRPLLENDAAARDIAIFFNHHAHKPIEIRDVAHQFGMTPVQLTRRFRTAFNVNPLQYLTSIRIKQACRLLLLTEWTLDVIAEKCGYENGFYLSRVFRKTMGVNPSEFRKQNRY